MQSPPHALSGTNILTASDSISLRGRDAEGNPSALVSTTSGRGDAQPILLAAPTITLADGARIETSTRGVGNAGAILLGAFQIAQQGLQITGPVVERLLLTGRAEINSSSRGAGDGGLIAISAAERVEIRGRQSGLFSATQGAGEAGQILLAAPQVWLAEAGQIQTSTSGGGDAGVISIGAFDLNFIAFTFVVEYPLNLMGSYPVRSSRRTGIRGSCRNDTCMTISQQRTPMHTGSPQGFWRWSVRGRWHQRRRPVRLGRQTWSTVITVLLCGLSVASVLVLWTTGHAQESLGIAPGRRLRPEPLPQLEERPTTPPPRQVLPPLPPPPPGAPEQLPQVRVFVQQINVMGSTVFSADELAQVTAPYSNQEVTTEGLEELRLALTRLYVDRGYINSGAVIPDQTVQDGVITFQIIEGTLSTIEITGNRWFRSSYVRRRLALGVTTPLNLLSLQERLQFLQQDDRIERFQAELKPGVRRGDSTLTVALDEALPFAIALVFNNYQSPTVGAENGSITLAHRNLTGHGDILSVAYGRSEGIDVDLDASYTLPLTVYDTTVQLQYQRTEFSVIEEPFTPLDIESTSEIYGMILRHPVYRTLRQEFALALSVEHLHNETSLLGMPFDFSPGAENGASTVFALRLTMEWTNRTPNQVLAARARFSVGLNAFDATIHDSQRIPDGEFFAWLGQFQWARRMTDWGLQMIGRLDVQLATDPLLSLEQIAVGGRYSVRGYRENELVRDNAVIASLEGQVPLVRNKPWADVLQLAPFVDVGNAWNTKVSTPDPRTLVSMGIGLRWALTLTRPFRWQPSLEIYWGYPFEDTESEGDNLQDLGLHFQVAVTGL